MRLVLLMAYQGVAVNLYMSTSSNSSENYWYMVGPRLQPCVAEDISPCPIFVSETPFRVISLRIPSRFFYLSPYRDSSGSRAALIR
jgi:hypothetical protein